MPCRSRCNNPALPHLINTLYSSGKPSPWRRRSPFRSRHRPSSPPRSPCSAWPCCSSSASSGRSGAWRERTGPARRRGGRWARRGPRGLACLCRCPKRNASYDV